MIKVKNLAVKKGNRVIIEEVNFNIQPGKIYVVIGKNGAGKTTLLETLTRSNRIQYGTIHWDQIDYAKLSLQDLAKRRAVLSQNVKIDFPIKVSEIVEMGTYVSKEPISKIKKESLIFHALQEVDMQDFKHRTFNTLSGGEQKRVLLAKCIVQLNCCHWADINKYIFLDEPLASLDIQQQFKLIELIKRIVKRRKVGVLAILHDVNLAAQFADEILIMKNGRLKYKGKPAEVLTSEKLKETMDIYAVVQVHPVLGCPHITALSKPVDIAV